jgi:hypothetical protein
MSIYDLPLPAALVKAIESGNWQTPENNKLWRSVFPENEIGRPVLYSFNGMKGETS